VSEQSGTASTRWRRVRLLLLIVGAVLLIAGVRELADNYTAEYDCIHQLQCHNDAGRTPTALDRLTAALGFGLENSTAIGDPLPSPRGTLLVVAGALTLVAAVLVGPRRRSAAAGSGPPKPMSAEYQLERYERLRERGTLSEEEFEQRKSRVIEPR